MGIGNKKNSIIDGVNDFFPAAFISGPSGLIMFTDYYGLIQIY